MNSDKTDFIWLGSRSNPSASSECTWGHLSRGPVWQSTYFHSSRSVFSSSLILSFASAPDCEEVTDNRLRQDISWLVHTLTAGRLDYCNAVLYLINTNVMKTLQSVFHSATRLIVRKRKFDRITPTLRDDLHSTLATSVAKITYKQRTIVCKCLRQSAPEYLRELCVPVTNTASRRHLRSAVRGHLQVLATRSVALTALADCVWPSPELWNNLPTTLWHSTLTYVRFCSQLKNHLFESASWLFRLLDRAISVHVCDFVLQKPQISGSRIMCLGNATIIRRQNDSGSAVRTSVPPGNRN